MSTDDNPRTDEILEAWLYALEKGFKQNASIRKSTVDPQVVAKLRLVGTRAFRRWLDQIKAEAWDHGALDYALGGHLAKNPYTEADTEADREAS